MVGESRLNFDLREKILSFGIFICFFVFLTLSVILALGFFVFLNKSLLIRLRNFLSTPGSLRIFIKNGCWILLNTSSISTEMVMYFSFLNFLNLVDYRQSFSNFMSTLHSCDEPNLVVVFYPFYVSLVVFDLLKNFRVFISFMEDTGLQSYLNNFTKFGN